MSSIMRCRSGLMALSVMRDAPVLMEVANPSSQDRTPRRAIVLAVSSAAAPYRASGLVLWRKAAVRGKAVSAKCLWVTAFEWFVRRSYEKRFGTCRVAPGAVGG